MPKHRPLVTSKSEYLEKAAARYDRLTRTPKLVGRPSQRDEDRKAIAEIARVNAGVSGPDFALWTQARWVKAIGAFKNESVSGKATIQKHLLAYLRNTPVVLQQYPPSVVQAKPLKDQFAHWYVVALSMAMIEATIKGSHPVAHSTVDVLHRELCRLHILTVRRRTQFTEAMRQAWCKKQLTGTAQVHPERQHTTPATPRTRKT